MGFHNYTLNQYEAEQNAHALKELEVSQICDRIALEIEEDNAYEAELLEFFIDKAASNWTKGKIINELSWELAKEEWKNAQEFKGMP